MLFLLLVASAAMPPPPAPRATARASVRVLSSASISATTWQSAPRRSERLIVDEFGRTIRLRTIEFE